MGTNVTALDLQVTQWNVCLNVVFAVPLLSTLITCGFS